MRSVSAWNSGGTISYALLAVVGFVTIGCGDEAKSSEPAKASLPAKPELPPLPTDAAAPAGDVTPTAEAKAIVKIQDSYIEVSLSTGDEHLAGWSEIIAGCDAVWEGGVVTVTKGADSGLLCVGSAKTKGAANKAALKNVRESAALNARAELAKFLNNKVTAWSRERKSEKSRRERAVVDSSGSHQESESRKASAHVEAYVNDRTSKAGVDAEASRSYAAAYATKVDHTLSAVQEICERTEFTEEESQARVKGAMPVGSWMSKDKTVMYVAIVVSKQTIKTARDFGEEMGK